MKITIACVGKIKEKYFTDAVNEYAKRLSRYCTLKILQVPDEKTPENASEKQEALIRQTEGRRLLDVIGENDYVAALAIKGKKYDSPSLSRWLDDLTLHGHSTVTFVIGGSLGLSDEVLKRADEQISFSDLTFPHQLMRVILLEQIYRCFRISRHEPYHK